MTAEEKEFKKYLQDARSEFTYEVSKYTVENNLALRTISDSFLIAFDQLNKAYHQAKLKEGEENDLCDRCNGFTQIEQGGNIVDCYACNGSGEKSS